MSFSLGLYIVLRPQGIRKQMKTLRKRHRVHIALGPVHTETFSCVFVLFTVLKGIENNQLIGKGVSDWKGRVKFVDDITVLEIIPRCSSTLMHVIVDEISTFASNRAKTRLGMELNSKKCKEMLI